MNGGKVFTIQESLPVTKKKDIAKLMELDGKLDGNVKIGNGSFITFGNSWLVI